MLEEDLNETNTVCHLEHLQVSFGKVWTWNTTGYKWPPTDIYSYKYWSNTSGIFVPTKSQQNICALCLRSSSSATCMYIYTNCSGTQPWMVNPTMAIINEGAGRGLSVLSTQRLANTTNNRLGPTFSCKMMLHVFCFHVGYAEIFRTGAVRLSKSSGTSDDARLCVCSRSTVNHRVIMLFAVW
jgi:hypothetical protein